MQILKGENSILRRTFIVYAVVVILSVRIINFKLFAWQYSLYTGWKYAGRNSTDYKNGVLYYDSITRFDPTNAQAYAYLGSCYYYLKEYDNAISAYQKAIYLRPDFFPYQNDLAVIYDATGQKEKAKALLNKSPLKK